jgi:regulatory protein
MIDPPDDIYRQALNRAIKILAIREHSTLELSQKLQRRGYDEDIVQRVIAECRQRNYLDDHRASGQLLESLKSKGFGIHRIRNELFRRGLPASANDSDPELGMSPEEEITVALQMALKKWKRLEDRTEPDKRRLRSIRFLRSRGFSEGAIMDVLKIIEKQV